MSRQDLVSVVMATYNDGEWLKKSINSILSQTYDNLELVITDDASTLPLTHEILKNYEGKDSRVHVYFLKRNGGAGIARNNSIKEARGRYIAFCDSDDIWAPEKLEKQVAFMNKNKVAVCYSSYVRVTPSGRLVGIVNAPKVITYNRMKLKDNIGFSTSIFDLSLLGKKYYMPSLRKRQDWALKLMVLKDCKVAKGVKEPLVRYSVRPNSISRKKTSLTKYHLAVYKTVLGYSDVKSYFMFAFVYMPVYTFYRIKTKIDSFIYIISKH